MQRTQPYPSPIPSPIAKLIAGLIATATLMPVAATLVTAALYIITPSKLVAASGGAIFTLTFWLLMTVLFIPYTTPDLADALSYNLLINRFTRIRTWADTLRDESKDHPSLSPYGSTSLDVTFNYIGAADRSLYVQQGIAWVSGIGYVNVSRLLHRAEEELILLEPVPAVIADGIRLEAAIANSAISNQEYYLRMLGEALDYLSPGRLHQSQDALLARVPYVGLVGEVAAPSAEEPLRKDAEVRTAIREASYALNEFQDDQTEKLVRVRNQLNRLIMLTGLVLYILLEFAIIARVPVSTLISATFFFLIGAGVGLFSRLYQQAGTDSSIGNTRLAGVQLMAAPLFSGLAAVGGVIVMQKVATSSGAFSFDLTLFNILVSAAFGLTPGLFFNAIQRQAAAMDKGK